MTAKEILAKIKAAFNNTEVITLKFDSYPIDGADPVYISSGTIAVSTPVFSDEAMTVPYPDGTYTVTGTSFSFTVAGGLVTAVDGSLDAQTAPAANPVTVTPLQYEAMQKEIDSLKAENAKIQAALNRVNILLEKHEKTIPGLFELAEKLTEEPAADPQTLNARQQQKFDHAKKREERLASFAKNIKTLKTT